MYLVLIGNNWNKNVNSLQSPTYLFPFKSHNTLGIPVVFHTSLQFSYENCEKQNSPKEASHKIYTSKYIFTSSKFLSSQPFFFQFFLTPFFIYNYYIRLDLVIFVSIRNLSKILLTWLKTKLH